MPQRCERTMGCSSAGSLIPLVAAVLVLAGCSDPAQGMIRKVAARVTSHGCVRSRRRGRSRGG